MPSGHCPTTFLERENTAEVVTVVQLAKRAGLRARAIYYAIKQAKGNWFTVAGLRYRMTVIRAEPLEPVGDWMLAALHRGQDGMVTRGDIRAARRWAADPANARWRGVVASGRADLSVEYGTVRVLDVGRVWEFEGRLERIVA